ncbi:MAG: hypothetical protein KF752_03800 [Pirellulaceae bacterium]|nr:hypothetical protein [Pirellulaceae bacterium]
MKRCIWSLIVCLLATPTLRADFTPIAGWDQQLFPSFLIGTAAIKSNFSEVPDNRLGDPNGLLGVEVVATQDNSKIEVTVEFGQYAETSQFSGWLPKQGETYTVFPKVKYRFEALSQCAQATPATVTYRVRLDGGPFEEKSATVTVRSIQDCPIKVQVDDEVVDTSLAFAVYVNEQHPFMDKLLREALDIGVVDSFTGYQAQSANEVLRQVYAIWDLLVARDVRYSSITTTAADSDQILSQNVRSLEDTVNNQQANCVDGSVLLVSLLRKIDIESFLILVPGHCYAGFFLDAEHTQALAIETTLIGVEAEEPDEVDALLAESVDASQRDEYSWPSFVQAIELGTHNFLSSQEKFQDESEADYHIIDISAARKLGVLPIPYRGKEKFVHFDHSEDLSEGDSDDEEEEDEEDDEDYEEGE